MIRKEKGENKQTKKETRRQPQAFAVLSHSFGIVGERFVWYGALKGDVFEESADDREMRVISQMSINGSG